MVTVDKKEKQDNPYIDSQDAFSITQKVITVQHEWDIYLYGSLKNYKDWIKISDLLYKASEGDRINLYISSPGGRLDITENVINAIRTCKGEVTGILTGHAASGATLLFLSCPSVIVEPHASMMLHYYSSFSYGKGQEIETKTQHHKEHITELMNTYYEGFLSDEELEDMYKGTDFYFSSKEIEKRLEKRMEFHKKIYEEAENKKKKETKKTTSKKKTTRKKSTKKKK